jgi:hypothetical protein
MQLTHKYFCINIQRERESERVRESTAFRPFDMDLISAEGQLLDFIK